ncbi:tRNA (guanine-N7-)-methyltransferase [Bacilli bacterium PM5-3]|nr:tRNA (guanine-N7-)-methyltransferase [Bacilli bacterium PM5-3]MDH6603767.1 tRNA (guanine-N7-)-methyltransferase [Bacilli bacterium PM5-9]
MRLRNNPKADDIIANSNYVIKEKQEKYFDNKKPIHLEIGIGKGDFIIGMAKKHPKVNFVGVEKFGTVLVKALEKVENEGLENVLLIKEDATNLDEYFNENTFECIYINFSDPWPKKRHYKRRLTYKSFLEIYERLLKKDGFLKQKTDNKSLFESSLISYNDYGTNFEMVSVDLHASEHAKENIMSEYERKFSSMNQPIYAINIKFKGDK